MAAVSLWTPLADPRIASRWFSLPNFYFLWPVPVITALTAYLAWRWIETGREVPPFLATMAIIPAGLSRAGDIRLSLFGAAVAHHLGHCGSTGQPDLHAARHAVAATDVLGYIAFIYWLFRGKVREGESYH